MNFKGRKFSKSRGGPCGRALLPEPLRPRPAALLPDGDGARDARHRVLVGGVRGAEQQRAGGDVGQPGQPDAQLCLQAVRRPSAGAGRRWTTADRELLARARAAFAAIGDLYAGCKFRAALGEAMALAREANGYLDRKAPWFQIKADRQAAATTRVRHPASRGQPEDAAGARSCRTRRSGCTSTWATTGSSSARSASSTCRRRSAATRR